MLLFGKGHNAEVYEYRDSPFHNEHLKYSQLLSFHYNNIEYKVGPELRMICLIFMTSSRFFFVNNNVYRPAERVNQKEVIQLENNKEMCSYQIHEIVRILSTSEKLRKEHQYLCLYQYDGTKLAQYKAFTVKFCDDFLESGLFLFFLFFSFFLFTLHFF